mgnify:CR=1 FL=1
MEDDKKKVIFSAGLALISFDNGETWLFTFKVEKENEINNAVLDLDKKFMNIIGAFLIFASILVMFTDFHLKNDIGYFIFLATGIYVFIYIYYILCL